MYRALDAAIVRTAAHPANLTVPPWPDLTADRAGQVSGWRDWLERVWAITTFADAVTDASPVLARQARRVIDGHELRARQVRRTVVSTLRYLLRATGRATPFGLFAGIAPARFGTLTTVAHSGVPRLVARVDGGWLAAVITRLEACDPLRQRLSVAVTDVRWLRDGRLITGLRQAPGAATGQQPAEVSLRHTPAIDLIVEAAGKPILVAELADTVAAKFPATPHPAIDDVLAHLITERVLISNLRPPMTTADPLAHLLAQLNRVDADQFPQARPIVQDLREIAALLAQHNAAPAPGVRETVTAAMTRVAAVERPLMVDLRGDLALTLAQMVTREAERAATALSRLTPHPFGSPVWRDYHSRFLERHGVGAAIGVLDLIHPGTGLGFPAGYRDSLLDRPATGLTERDTRLIALAQRAALARTVEVTVDETLLTDLETQDRATAAAQPHTELAFRLHAATPAAVDRGEFTLVVAGVFRAAGATTGRVLDLLDTADQQRITDVYAGLPTVRDGALRAQMSCPPLFAATENVARHPAVLANTLPISEHRAPTTGRVDLDDLVVVGDPHRLVLWSQSQQRPVEPALFSAVEFTNFTHPLARFLAELPTARTATCAAFAWGPAATQLPFLPRLRNGRTVLAVARWIVTAADLPGPAPTWPEWVDGVGRWRERAMVPDTVFLGSTDQRLPLNLTEPAHLRLLRDAIDRHGRATLHEAPTSSELGWIGGHAHEIIVPLAATSAPAPARTMPVHPIDPDHGHLPGAGRWLYAKLFAHPDRHTAVLGHLPTLLSTWDTPPPWWFLPYRDPDHHLRLRVRLTTPDEFGQAARRVGDWAARLRGLGLISGLQLDTYQPETGRFGPAAAMAAAEAAFAEDSAAALAQREHRTVVSAADPLAVTAASLVDITASFLGDIAAGMRWLTDHLTTDSAPAPDRRIHTQATRLSDPTDEWAALRAQPGSAELIGTWQRRSTALAAYRAILTTAGISPDTVLGSLLHLHCLRANGINPDTERVCHRLARAAALSWTARTRGTQ
ncbi:lantibiotic dehydratase [Actinokineospora cianjurensis]|uniref:Thiopeptide-type bacteriocin biosynthesis protein n=1 Tax=Actinokineospora cianjurensis TaxID=585224 RepID=A0A421AXB2_9PSEU|nr:lantibiotic dehydratase [Actinokineospora cianjurensis]RLK54456.1 thiopeptide-type bacteriocin biosynthesis protein [Actinokineospora cianjurensis]